MKTTKVKALTSFVHGRVQMHQGDEQEFSKGDADDLVKAGMVQIVADDPQPEPQPADDGVDDLLGEEKAEPAPENKMEAAPKNKAEAKPKAK